MDIEKLMTEYISLKWDLESAKDKLRTVENKISSIKEKLDDAGILCDTTVSHDTCGGVVVALKSEPDNQTYYCIHCHQKGSITVEYEHDFSGYATFIS